MAMKMVPRDDVVLCIRQDNEEKTPGGILIPDKARENSEKGKVLAVGPGKIDPEWHKCAPGLEPMRLPIADIHEGDIVYFGKYTGTELTQHGVKYLLLRADDILAVELVESKDDEGK